MTSDQTEVVPEPTVTVSEIEHPRTTTEYSQRKDTDARVVIAVVLVISYVVLLTANIAIPFILVRISPVPSADALTAFKDLSTPLTGAVTSVTGVLGFVLGYYFKAEEAKRA